MQATPYSSGGAVAHRTLSPPTITYTHHRSNSPDAILSNLSFLQRMADAFEEQGNYAECVRSAESALLLRQANAATVAAALTACQQHNKKKVGTVPAAAAPRRTDSSSNDSGMVALTEKGDVLLPLEISQQAQDVVQRCNCYAVEALRNDQFDSAAFFLNHAMFLTDGDDDDLSDLSGGQLCGESWNLNANRSDRWWWRRLLQQKQQTVPSKYASTSDKKADVEHTLDITNANLNTEASNEAETATALRACFRDTPHDQQLRLTLRAATLNHLGCLEQRRGRLGAAIVFFRMAIRTSTQLDANFMCSASTDADVAANKASIASTCLNLCTVLNAVGRHAEAVQACERVVPLLQQILQETITTTSSKAARASILLQSNADNDVGGEKTSSSSSQDSEEAHVATMLVVAYYNLGVSLERQGAASRGSKNIDHEGPQRAFQQAVQVSQAYHLVPASCRNIEAVMQALRHPRNLDENRNKNNKTGGDVALEKHTVEEEKRPRPHRGEQMVAVRKETTSASATAVQPPNHALPRIAVLPADAAANFLQRQPRPPSSDLSPSPPPHTRGTATSVEPAGNVLVPFAGASHGALFSAVRRPSTDTRMSGSNTRLGCISSSTYPTPTAAQNSSPRPPSLFKTCNAWSSPFASTPSPVAPPAVLAPLPPGVGGAATAMSARATSTAPSPLMPPPALLARPTVAGTNFAATAPPAFIRPSPPPPPPLRSDLTSSGSERAPAESEGGLTAPAMKSSSNPFGRRTFGSGSLSLLAGRASSVAGGARQAFVPSQSGGGAPNTIARLNLPDSAANSSAKRASTRGPLNRLAAVTGMNASRASDSTEIGRAKHQRSKQQKSMERRQQREAAAADAVLAERIYQQLVSEKEKGEVERSRHAAVAIQRIWRGVLARTWVATLIRAAVCLQRAVRHFLVKARAEHARVAAEQARIRAEQAARQEAACRVLQVRVRQFLRRLQIRREYRAMQARLFYAARTIQRGYRAFLAHQAEQLTAEAEKHRREDEQYRFRKKVAARRIQSAYLNYKTKRAELNAYQVLQHRIRSIVRIQAVVRGYLTRAWYAYYRVYRREQEVRSAAMQAKLAVIQSACRAICSAYYGQQRAVQALLRMRERRRNAAATKMQCMWRCHVARIRCERLQAEHDRDVRHATRIQRWYRMRTQRRVFLVWQAEQKRMRAATRLQRWIRTCWQSAKAREFAAYHAELLRQQQLQRLQSRAITVMQACANAYLSGRLVASVRDTFERNDAIARRWQCVGRGFAARLEMALDRRVAYQVALKEKEMAQRTVAARVLQRAWRCAAAKDKVESMRRAVAAADVIARAYRVYRARVQLAELRATRKQHQEDAAARRIQRAVRGLLYGRRAREMDEYYRAEYLKKMLRLRRAEAAVMIQSQWRGYVTRKVVQEERVAWEALSAAATRIQHAWKARLARQQLHQTLAERIIERNQYSCAALTLQCFWRKMRAARLVARLRQETRRRLAAVLVLQSWWRMQMAQREFSRVRQRRREEAALEVYYAIQWEKNVTLINAFLRQRESQVLALRQLQQQLICMLSAEKRCRFLYRHEAATKIQALFRGHYERYYVRGLRAQAREEKRRAAELLSRQQRAATTIQCAYRSAQARHTLAELRQAEFDRVQASHAGYLESADPGEVVRELFWLNSTYQQREATLRRKHEVAKRCNAAARIQRAYRHHRARRVVAAALDSHQQERAARLLQDYWRHHHEVRRIKEHQRRQTAATRLQSHIRGWMVRRSWPLYRASVEAERQERVLVQDVLDHAAIVLQCFWRRVEAQRTAARRRLQRQAEHDARAQQEAAAVIQEAFRNHQRRIKMNVM